MFQPAFDPSFQFVMSIVEVIFWILPFVVIGYFVVKWATKDLRAAIIRFVTLLIPVYVVGIFVILANPLPAYVPYLVIPISPLVLYFDPPLLWDVQFQLAIDQGNVIGVAFSAIMITFITFWFAYLIWSSHSMRASLTMKKSAVDDARPSRKRRLDGVKVFLLSLVASMSIVLILGLGMTHFLSWIFLFLFLLMFNPIGMTIITILLVAIFAFIAYKIIKHKKSTKLRCEWVDGIEVCTEVRE